METRVVLPQSNIFCCGYSVRIISSRGKNYFCLDLVCVGLHRFWMMERAITSFGYSSVLFQQCKNLNHLKQIHANLLKLPTPALTSLFSFAAASPNPAFFSYISTIFLNLPCRTTFLYNTIIRGHVSSNQPQLALYCYKQMLQERIIKNNYTFTPLIKACSMISINFQYMGVLVHAHVVKLGFCCDPFIVSALIEYYASIDMCAAEELFNKMPVRDVVLWTMMVDGYGKAGMITKARELFDKMPERNVISWSAVMAAYSRAGDFREVLQLYRRMEELGLKVNESILVSALTACAHLGALAQGLWIHSYVEKCHYTSNPILATALVDMYSKCGRIDLALSVFKTIHDKDTGAWNAIISGMAMNGFATQSLELFDDMILSGTQPTEATFVALLTACTHAKLILRGLSLFVEMGRKYKIEPKIEHFACVVDLLARSGKLEEAENFVHEKMGGVVNGDANIWGALLGACRIYGKVEIGNRLWRELQASKGVVGYGIHVLAYNMYREAGWDTEAKSVRELIEKKQRKKTPGCSAVEVGGNVEEFIAGDVVHPQAVEICEVLHFLLCDVSCPVTLYEFDEASCVL